MRAVFDTNVFVSAFVTPASQGERALLLAKRRRFELCTSVAILTETAGKLREKFAQPPGDIKRALRLISRMAVVRRTSPTLTVVEDDADNRILECAVEVHADVVVTGDRHLLALRQYHGIAIIRLADFLRMFPDAPAPPPLAARPRGKEAGGLELAWCPGPRGSAAGAWTARVAATSHQRAGATRPGRAQGLAVSRDPEASSGTCQSRRRRPR